MIYYFGGTDISIISLLLVSIAIWFKTNPHTNFYGYILWPNAQRLGGLETANVQAPTWK